MTDEVFDDIDFTYVNMLFELNHRMVQYLHAASVREVGGGGGGGGLEERRGEEGQCFCMVLVRGEGGEGREVLDMCRVLGTNERCWRGICVYSTGKGGRT